MLGEHFPQNVMEDADEIERFYDRCSDFMRALLDALADAPPVPRPFPQIEDGMGWPRRRIASVLGGVFHLRHKEFGGRRPYRFMDDKRSESGRWELWMDADQRAPCTRRKGTAPGAAFPGFARSANTRKGTCRSGAAFPEA